MSEYWNLLPRWEQSRRVREFTPFRQPLTIGKKESESEVAQSCPTLCSPWTVAHQAPPSMGFSRQEYWSGLPFPSPGDLPDPGIEPRSPTLQADALTSAPAGKLSYGRGIFKWDDQRSLLWRNAISVEIWIKRRDKTTKAFGESIFGQGATSRKDPRQGQYQLIKPWKERNVVDQSLKDGQDKSEKWSEARLRRCCMPW